MSFFNKKSRLIFGLMFYYSILFTSILISYSLELQDTASPFSHINKELSPKLQYELKSLESIKKILLTTEKNILRVSQTVKKLNEKSLSLLYDIDTLKKHAGLFERESFGKLPDGEIGCAHNNRDEEYHAI